MEDRKKALKRQRIKDYFLEAAKALIINEGVENVSVRKVADDAGYSFATLYKYFADLNALLWDVKQSMLLDFTKYLKEQSPGNPLDASGLKKVFRIYTAYFIEHPYVFKFFYFHMLTRPQQQGEEAPDFDAMTRAAFQGFVASGQLQQADIETVARTCIYTVHGMLTLLFSGNGDLTASSLHEELDRIIDYLLPGRS